MSAIWLVQLVFDCAEPDDIARFWGRALEYRHRLAYATDEEVAAFRADNPQFEGRGRIDDRELRRPPVYIQRVPEAKQARNRLRPEVAVPEGTRPAAVDQFRHLGAATDGGEFRDIEGNEFTLVEDPRAAERHLRSIVFDCLDPGRMLEFWSQATGYRPSEGRCDPVGADLTYDAGAFTFDGRRFLHITGAEAEPAGARLFDLSPGLAFLATDVPKVGKNRLHLDLNSTDAPRDRERLVGLGATVIRWDTDQVLADPEGNEFCLSPLAGRNLKGAFQRPTVVT